MYEEQCKLLKLQHMECWKSFITPRVFLESKDDLGLEFCCPSALVVQPEHEVLFQVQIKKGDTSMTPELLSKVTGTILSICYRCMELQKEPHNEDSTQ